METQETMSLADHVSMRNQLTKELRELKEWHARSEKELESRIDKHREAISQWKNGLDHSLIQTAESVLFVEGEFGYGDDQKMVLKAIDDIAAGCPVLKHEYFGTKDYDRWHHQGTQSRYGCGPRHGSVVFAIKLRDRKNDLTDDEKDAAIYYLLNLKEIHKAKAES